MAEVNHGGSNTPIINYGVSSREGKIYRSSKTEEAGFQKVELQSGGVTYHKYCDGLEGKITYLSRVEREIVETDGKKKKLDDLKMFINDGVTTQALSLKTYSQEWKLMVKHLFNVDFSKGITVSFYKKKVEGSDKHYLNCSLKYTGEQTEDGKAVYPEWLNTTSVEKGGEVPVPVLNKKGEWDWTDNDIWYLDRVGELIKRFMDFKENNQTSAPVAQPQSKPETTQEVVPSNKKEYVAEPVGKANEPNDLPF